MLLLLLLPLALAASVDRHITDGVDQDIKDFPWQGSYRANGGTGHNCGCVFIGGRNLLTAGHCGGSSSSNVELGHSTRQQGTTFEVASVLRHPNYDQGPGFTPNDISVVLASEDIEGTDISGAGLPDMDNQNPGGIGWITGWGRTCGSCALPMDLVGREIDIITDQDCTNRWTGSFNPDSMICVYDGEGGACNGDSGGPMSQGTTVYGLASWVASGCLPSYPSAYNRVGAFTDWVCANTNDEPTGC